MGCTLAEGAAQSGAPFSGTSTSSGEYIEQAWIGDYRLLALSRGASTCSSMTLTRKILAALGFFLPLSPYLRIWNNIEVLGLIFISLKSRSSVLSECPLKWTLPDIMTDSSEYVFRVPR